MILIQFLFKVLIKVLPKISQKISLLFKKNVPVEKNFPDFFFKTKINNYIKNKISLVRNLKYEKLYEDTLSHIFLSIEIKGEMGSNHKLIK